MDYLFDPKELEVHPFEKLGNLPLESDFIIIHKKGSADELVKLYPDFNFLVPCLGEISVIEYKSPLDTLSHNDFDTLRIYRLLTKKKYGLREDHRVVAISMASKFEGGYAHYLKKNGYRFTEVHQGIYGDRDEYRSYYRIDLSIIGRMDPESFINLFSSNYKQYSQEDRPNIRHGEIITYIWQAIFRRKLGMMNNIEIRQLPEFTTSVEEMIRRIIESLSPEERLAGLKPKERLAGLKPEERLAGLKPEERLAGLSEEEIKKLKDLLNRTGN